MQEPPRTEQRDRNKHRQGAATYETGKQAQSQDESLLREKQPGVPGAEPEALEHDNSLMTELYQLSPGARNV